MVSNNIQQGNSQQGYPRDISPSVFTFQSLLNPSVKQTVSENWEFPWAYGIPKGP